jgi:protein-tyrosine phosphatase
MPLEDTQKCVNLRDVGEFVNLIAGQPLMPECRLYRGGKLDAIFSAEVIHSPATIINLRKSVDPYTFGAVVFHFPITNDYEKYETQRPEVRQWLTQVARVFENPELHYPVLIHCTSGRDRTGVVVAALMRLLAIPDPIIIEEYLLSDGDVQEQRIRQALDGIGNPITYFRRLDIERIRVNMLQGK